MILFINGLQWTGFKKLEWGCVGESSCADSWGRALATGNGLSIPCFAERRYGGVMEDELLSHSPPSCQGDRWPRIAIKERTAVPIPPYGVQSDARAGLGQLRVTDIARGCPRDRLRRDRDLFMDEHVAMRPIVIRGVVGAVSGSSLSSLSPFTSMVKSLQRQCAHQMIQPR